MSAGSCRSLRPATRRRMGTFERYLTLWVALCIVVGIGLGQLVPGAFHALGAATVAQVNLPVAVLVWLMIVPMLLKIDLARLRQVGGHWRGIAATVGVNWLVKPFSMALLGWLFIGWLFRPWLPAGQVDSYIAGLILLAAAPCTAMVFVWSNLLDGEPHFTLSQVALNDTHHGGGLRAHRRPAARPVLHHRALGHAAAVRRALHRRAGHRGPALARGAAAPGGQAALARTLRTARRRCRCAALLLTLVLLFGLQGEQIVRQPTVILLLAVPILIQVYFNAGLAYWLNRRLGSDWCVAGPSALIGASNFFELAVAAAIALFGFQSGAALATVVGVLVEVPVMLSVVHIVDGSRGWYERRCRRGARADAWSLPDRRHLPALRRDLLAPPDLARLEPGSGRTIRRASCCCMAALRERSYSRLLTEEAARLLQVLGAETRIFDPRDLPMPNSTSPTIPRCRSCARCRCGREGQVWCSPEVHGAVTGVFKNQIDWLPLELGAVRPTQGRTLAVMQVSGGSQSFNAVNTLRLLGRWMRMFTIPNQSSVPKAYEQFDEAGRMRPGPLYDRVVDVMEELVRFTWLTRDRADALVDRYSERAARIELPAAL